jgi:probable phosphoglycerate mutase
MATCPAVEAPGFDLGDAVSHALDQDPGRAPLMRLAAERPLELNARSFVFVRHGETEGNRLKIFQTAEQPLNARGLEQAVAASAALAGHRVQRIVASTMPRAWRTAEIVAEPHKMRPLPSDLIRERWFGSLVGTPSVAIDWGYDPPGGERLVDFVARTRQGLAAALADGEGIIVVAHGGNLHVLAGGLGIALAPELVANATPLLFERGAGSWRVTPVGPIHELTGSFS